IDVISPPRAPPARALPMAPQMAAITSSTTIAVPDIVTILCLFPEQNGPVDPVQASRLRSPTRRLNSALEIDLSRWENAGALQLTNSSSARCRSADARRRQARDFPVNRAPAARCCSL